MTNIRSNYIKNLLADKDELGKTLEESTKEALKGIVDEAVNKNLRSMISEANEDDFDEEDVNDTENIVDNPEASEEDAAEEVVAEPEESGEESETEETGEGEDDLWDSLDQYKGENDEYDLTGMDSEDVIKVLKVMKPEDGVRVVKKDNGTIELKDEENDTEYIIDIEGDDEIEVEVERDDDGDDEDVFEIDVDECGGLDNLGEGKVDLGYTDNYQDKTAMTMDPDDGEKTRKWNAGTPTGNDKRWVGNKGDMSPFKEEVANDENIVKEEAEVPEETTVDESAMTMANKRTDREPNQEDNGHAREKRHRNKTGVNPTMNGSQNESIAKKAKAIFEENKQLKAIAEQIKERLNEACVINASLGKIIKLVTENTTTRDEKIDIVNRFNNVKTINEGQTLYETIARELKNSHAINNVDNVMTGPLTEAKKTNIVETPMFQSADLTETIDFMKRLEKIK